MTNNISTFSKCLLVSAFFMAGCFSKKEPAPTSQTTTAAAPTSAAPTNSNELVIGEFGSMTGPNATFGVSTHRGIELAFEEINAKGGIKGKKLKLVSLDDRGNPDEAAAVVSRLITQNNVLALLGEVASSNSLAAAPIAQKYKIPMISPSSTNPKVTSVGDYIFRVCFIDPFQGTVMAKFAKSQLKAAKVAVLRDVKSDYSVGLADYFNSKFKELGGQIVSDLSYVAGDTDFKAQLTQIRGNKPDAIFIPGYYTEVGLIARQVRQMGIKATLIGGDGWDSSKLYEIGKEAINGAFFSNHYTTESTEQTVKEFITSYQKKFNEVPDGLAALGYDAARILIGAIERVEGDITSKSIRDEVAKTNSYRGVTGVITLNENRDAVKSAVVVKVDGTNNRYVTTVDP